MTNGYVLCIIIPVAEVKSSSNELGSIAQLGEHLPYKQEVTGSSPVVPTTKSGPVVQSVSTPACHAGGRRFESVRGRHIKHHPFGWCFYLQIHRMDSNHSMGMSSGHSLEPGSTGSTPLFNESVRGRHTKTSFVYQTKEVFCNDIRSCRNG